MSPASQTDCAAEILGWVCFTVATQTAAAGLFTLVGAAQMAQWAIGKHARLRKVRILACGGVYVSLRGCVCQLAELGCDRLAGLGRLELHLLRKAQLPIRVCTPVPLSTRSPALHIPADF